MIDPHAVCRTIDKRDRIGLPAVFDELVRLGLERWQALAWCYWIAPPAIKKRIMGLAA